MTTQPVYPGDPGDPALSPYLPYAPEQYVNQTPDFVPSPTQAAQPTLEDVLSGNSSGNVFGGPAQQFAPSTTAQSQSNLAAMLQAANMVEASAFQSYPQAGYNDRVGVYPDTQYQRAGKVNEGSTIYQDPNYVAGDPKVQGSQRVYMGHSNEVVVASDQDAVKPTITGNKAKSITEAQAFNLPYQWYGDKAKMDKLETALRRAGIKVTSFAGAVKAWQGAVSTASNIYAASKGHSLVTPWDVLENQAKTYANGPGNTHVQTTTRVNDLSEGQAWQILRGTMQQLLGKDPTQDEVNQFLAKANNDAANSPSTTTTTSKLTPSGKSAVSNSTVDPGYTSADAQQAAYNELHNSADYGHYQAATTYFNALLSAVGEAAGSQ